MIESSNIAIARLQVSKQQLNDLLSIARQIFKARQAAIAFLIRQK